MPTTVGNALLKRQADGSFLAEGARPDTDTYTLVSTPNLREITAVRLEVLADASLPKKGPGRQENNGNLHLSEFVAQVFLPGAAQREKAPIRRATADFNQDGWTISHAIDGNEKTAWGIHPREGESHTAVFEFENKLSLTNGAQLVLQLKQLHGDGHLIGKFRLAVTGDPAQRASVLPAELVEARRLPPGERTEAQRLLVATHALRATAEERLAAMPPALRAFGAGPKFIAVAEGSFHKAWREPKVVQVLKRGDIEKPIKPASPGAIAAIGELPGRFALSNSNDEASRRVALAEWLADARNPLTWRSAVNRVWHHHFGRGIADTLNDFGRMGSPPSHPELLEWLACEFRDSGGTLKPLHRMIVTSAAYRRGAGRDQAALAKDPDNILLWCRQSRRLDAETYRDTVLAITGRLDLTMGGPGAQQFKLGKPIQLTPTVDYTSFDWDSPAATRRSIYRFVYRGLQDPFLEALDFPDAAQLAPVRSFSSSALQALVLLNNDFVLHQSTRFAERLEKMDAELAGRVRQAFRLALQREPNAGEAADFAAFANQRGLPAMCRVLLNSNEFLFVN